MVRNFGDPWGGKVYSSFPGEWKKLIPHFLIPRGIEIVIPHFPHSSRKTISWGIGNSIIKSLHPFFKVLWMLLLLWCLRLLILSIHQRHLKTQLNVLYATKKLSIVWFILVDICVCVMNVAYNNGGDVGLEYAQCVECLSET